MILRFIWKNFRRRKMRTFLMVLSLTVGIALIVALSATVETIGRSNVELVARESGEFDLAVTRRDTSLDPFIDVGQMRSVMMAADPAIAAVHPRFDVQVEIANNLLSTNGTMLAIEPEVEEIGTIDVVEGEFSLGEGEVALLEDTAFSIACRVDICFDMPLQYATLAMCTIHNSSTVVKVEFLK